MKICLGGITSYNSELKQNYTAEIVLNYILLEL